MSLTDYIEEIISPILAFGSFIVERDEPRCFYKFNFLFLLLNMSRHLPDSEERAKFRKNILSRELLFKDIMFTNETKFELFSYTNG